MHGKHKDPKSLRAYCTDLGITQFQLQAQNGEVSQGELRTYEILDSHEIKVSFAWLYDAREFVLVGRGKDAEVFVKTWRHHPIHEKVSSEILLRYDHFYPQKNKGRVKIVMENGEVAYFISKNNEVALTHDPDDIQTISVSRLLLPMSSEHVVTEQLKRLV